MILPPLATALFGNSLPYLPGQLYAVTYVRYTVNKASGGKKKGLLLLDMVQEKPIVI